MLLMVKTVNLGLVDLVEGVDGIGEGSFLVVIKSSLKSREEKLGPVIVRSGKICPANLDVRSSPTLRVWCWILAALTLSVSSGVIAPLVYLTNPDVLWVRSKPCWASASGSATTERTKREARI